MFGRCQACLCKDNHITDLQSQLAKQTELIKDLVAPKPYAHATLLEANQMLDGGSTNTLILGPEHTTPPKEVSDAEQQAMDMLSGSYN